MKGKVKYIVGIVVSALLFPVSAYGTFMFYVALALAVGLNEEGFTSDAGKLLAILIVSAVIMILSLVFLILSAVKLAKVNKKEKELKLEQPTTTTVETTEETPVEE